MSFSHPRVPSTFTQRHHHFKVHTQTYILTQIVGVTLYSPFGTFFWALDHLSWQSFHISKI